MASLLESQPTLSTRRLPYFGVIILHLSGFLSIIVVDALTWSPFAFGRLLSSLSLQQDEQYQLNF